MIVMGVTGHGPTADPLPGVGPWLVDPRIDGLSDQAHAGGGFPLVGRLVVALLVGMRLGVSGVLAPPGQDVEDGLGLHGGQSPARRPVDHGDVVLDLVRVAVGDGGADVALLEERGPGYEPTVADAGDERGAFLV